MIPRRLSQQGSALIFALGFMVVTMIIALGVHTLVSNQLQASGRLRQRVTAEYLAQGGVARAIGWFNSRGYLPPQASNLSTTVPVMLASNNAAVVLPSNYPNSYTDILGLAESGVVTSYNSFMTSQSVSGGSYSVVASLMNLQPETWEVLATAREGSVQRQVGALLIRPQDPLFRDSLFGRDFVTFNSAYTDSYDSSLGLYGGANLFHNGSIASNGTIALNGPATVNGDATPGPGYTVTNQGINTVVTGSTAPEQTPRTLAPLVIPIGAVNIGAINLSGHSTTTLTAGTYLVTSISISGQAQLNIDSSGGPVRLYVAGAISVGGSGISNTSTAPQSLFIAETGNAGVSFSGNGNFYGTVYAPNSPLSVGGQGQLYGGFVGASVTLNGNGGAAIHYDQNLRRVPPPPLLLKLVAEWEPS